MSDTNIKEELDAMLKNFGLIRAGENKGKFLQIPQGIDIDTAKRLNSETDLITKHGFEIVRVGYHANVVSESQRLSNEQIRAQHGIVEPCSKEGFH